jgi:hypothetical protein
MPTRPRSPFFSPYHPPIGLSAERPQASTVPSLAGFCSSADPSSTQSPRSRTMADKSSMTRASYSSTVLPTVHTMTSVPSRTSRCIV